MFTASWLRSVSRTTRYVLRRRHCAHRLQRMGFIDADAVVIRAIDHVFDIEVPASQILATQNCYEDKHDCAFQAPELRSSRSALSIQAPAQRRPDYDARPRAALQ